MITVHILGTGTSTGVPFIGCKCEVCRSTDSRDKRLRCSALVKVNGTTILFDCGPDFRQQVLKLPFEKIDAVFLTHEHYDHIGGLDDLRPYRRFGEVNVYADEICGKHIVERIPYCFTPKEKRYPGAPAINLEFIKPHIPINVNGVEVMPIQVMHGKLPILGFRVGDLAYITDMKTMETTELQYLIGVKYLIVNALRIDSHPTHQSLAEAITFTKLINPQKTYFIHMSHDIGLHANVNKELPFCMELAYDGMCLELE